MLTIIERLIIKLEDTESIMHGLCDFAKINLNFQDYKRFSNYLHKNIPKNKVVYIYYPKFPCIKVVPSNCYHKEDEFFWKPGNKQARLNWLKKHKAILSKPVKITSVDYSQYAKKC